MRANPLICVLIAACLSPAVAYATTGCDADVQKHVNDSHQALASTAKLPASCLTHEIIQVDSSASASPTLRQTPIDNLTQTIWTILLAGIGAAVVAGWIAHRSKVAEFRQKWINDLREDIADYVGTAERWAYEFWRTNHPNANRETLLPISNEAFIILYRIKLRVNPYNNLYKESDDAFLKSLDALIDPNKWDLDNFQKSWRDLADCAVGQGQEILKREWQVTKAFFLRPITTLRRLGFNLKHTFDR
jgi:hypothetical protein